MTSEGELYRKIREDMEAHEHNIKIGFQVNESVQSKWVLQWIKEVLDEACNSAPKDALKKLDPFEWMKWFGEWFGSGEK